MGTYDFASVFELETMVRAVLNVFQLRPIAPDKGNLKPKLIRLNQQTTNRNLLSDRK